MATPRTRYISAKDGKITSIQPPIQYPPKVTLQVKLAGFMINKNTIDHSHQFMILSLEGHKFNSEYILPDGNKIYGVLAIIPIMKDNVDVRQIEPKYYEIIGPVASVQVRLTYEDGTPIHNHSSMAVLEFLSSSE